MRKETQKPQTLIGETMSASLGDITLNVPVTITLSKKGEILDFRISNGDVWRAVQEQLFTTFDNVKVMDCFRLTDFNGQFEGYYQKWKCDKEKYAHAVVSGTQHMFNPKDKVFIFSKGNK